MEFINTMYNSKFSGVVAAAGTTLTYLFGGWDEVLKALVLFMVLDYLTGFLKSYKNKTLSSKKGMDGFIKKIGMFVILIIAVQLDTILPLPSPIFRTCVCFFFIANEGLSIMENWSEMGLPIPSKIKDTLIQVKDKNDKGEVK